LELEKEEKFTYAGDYPLIENGTYEAQCIDSHDVFICKTRKRILRFKITIGKYQGVKLSMFFNIPYDKQVRQGSKYYKNWVAVNNWQKPTRNANLSPRLFRNKVFKIETRTVTPEHNKKPMPREFWYSVVDSIELIS